MKRRVKKYICLIMTILCFLSTMSFSVNADTAQNAVNLAINKSVKASGFASGAEPEYACDGINDNADYTAWRDSGENGCPWLIIDLGLPYSFDEIIIEARKNSTEAERSNFEVYVGNNEELDDKELLYKSDKDVIPTNGAVSIDTKNKPAMRYIMITKTAAEAFSIGEVKVMIDKSAIKSMVGMHTEKILQPYFGDDRKYYSYNDLDGSEAPEQVALLSALGIMQGFEDGNYYPYSFVTKAEFTSYVTRLIGATGYAGESFADVDSRHWANEYVEAAYSIGIVSGNGDMLFEADKNISYVEAYKIALCALGYGEIANQKGGWPSGYLKLATELNLAHGTTVNAEGITHIDCAKILFNLLSKKYITRLVFGKNDISQTSDNTYLSDRYKIRKAYGILDGAGECSLTSYDSHLNKNYISIDGNPYYCEIPDIENYIGYYVSFWYSFDEEIAENAVITVIRNKRNTSVMLDDESFITASGYTVEYFDINNKKEKLKYRPDADVIYNNRAYLEYDAEHLFDSFSDISFIDNDDDGVYDCIIITDEETGIVSFVNELTKTIYFKNEIGEAEYNEDVKFIMSDSNEVISGELLKENDVLNIVSAPNAEEAVIYVTRNAIYGQITEMIEKEVRIKGKLYKVAADFYGDELDLSDEGYFYLDRNEKICYADIEKSMAGVYGYLLKAGNVGLDEYKMRIYTSGGKFQDYALAKKILIDGREYTSGEFDKILQRLSNTKDSGICAQPVRYVVDINKKLKLIDTQKTDMDNEYDLFRKVMNNEVVYYSEAKIFDARYPVADEAVVMRVPENVSDTSDFELQLVSRFKDRTAYSFYGYTDNEDDEIKLILTYGESTFDKEADMAVVQGVYMTIDEEDNEINCIKVLHNGSIATYVEKTSGLIKKENIAAGDIVALAVDDRGRLNNIKKCFYREAMPEDAYEYAISYDQPVKGPDRAVNAPDFSGTPSEYINMFQKYFIAYGTVFKKEGLVVGIEVSDDKGNIPSKMKNDGKVLFDTSRAKIYVIDSGGRKNESRIRIGTIDDIVDAKSGTASKLVIRSLSGVVSFICVIN